MRLSCELEVHFEILPSPTCEGANSKQPKCKATLTLGKKEVGSKGKGGGREDVFLIVQTARHPSGVQYKVNPLASLPTPVHPHPLPCISFDNR